MTIVETSMQRRQNAIISKPLKDWKKITENTKPRVKLLSQYLWFRLTVILGWYVLDSRTDIGPMNNLHGVRTVSPRSVLQSNTYQHKITVSLNHKYWPNNLPLGLVLSVIFFQSLSGLLIMHSIFSTWKFQQSSLINNLSLQDLEVDCL